MVVKAQLSNISEINIESNESPQEGWVPKSSANTAPFPIQPVPTRPKTNADYDASFQCHTPELWIEIAALWCRCYRH